MFIIYGDKRDGIIIFCIYYQYIPAAVYILLHFARLKLTKNTMHDAKSHIDVAKERFFECLLLQFL